MARTVTPEGVASARERIFRAAEQLFAEKGYDGTAIVEITELAGVNRGLPFYYWKDKRALYAAVVEGGLGLFIRMAEETISGLGTASERLAAFARGHLRLLWHQPLPMRVVDRCLLDGHVEELGLGTLFRETVARLEQLFQRAADDGELRAVDPELAARVLLGPGFIFSMWRQFEGERFSEERLAAFISDFLIHAFKRAE
ncbi:MAG: TetR/AcrR family transcriptional regulator [Armatimonadota bacterium]